MRQKYLCAPFSTFVCASERKRAATTGSIAVRGVAVAVVVQSGERGPTGGVRVWAADHGGRSGVRWVGGVRWVSGGIRPLTGGPARN